LELAFFFSFQVLEIGTGTAGQWIWRFEASRSEMIGRDKLDFMKPNTRGLVLITLIMYVSKGWLSIKSGLRFINLHFRAKKTTIGFFTKFIPNDLPFCFKLIGSIQLQKNHHPGPIRIRNGVKNCVSVYDLYL